MSKVKFELEPGMLSKSRRTKAWAKTVDEVDRSQKNGYAFKGEWLRFGAEEAEAGTIVLLYEHDRRWGACVAVGVVQSEVDEDGWGSIKWFAEAGDKEPTLDGPKDIVSGKSWALELRDWVAELLEADGGDDAAENNQLAGVSTEALVRELARRAAVEAAKAPVDQGEMHPAAVLALVGELAYGRLVPADENARRLMAQTLWAAAEGCAANAEFIRELSSSIREGDK